MEDAVPSPAPSVIDTWGSEGYLWLLVASVALVCLLALCAVAFARGWWQSPEEAAFSRDMAAVEKELAALEESLGRPAPVIGLASARDIATKAAWEQELRRRQEPHDDDDGFLADGTSDDERVRASVRRRVPGGGAPPAMPAPL